MTELIDGLYKDAETSTIIVGVFTLPERRERLGIVRVIIDLDVHTKAWPKALKFRRAVQVDTNESTFILFGDQEFMTPIAAIAWHESCDLFVEAVERYGMYMVEVYTRREMTRAMVTGEAVEPLASTPIDEEQFKYICGAVIDMDLVTPQAKPN